jgi:hypothetical protein
MIEFEPWYKVVIPEPISLYRLKQVDNLQRPGAATPARDAVDAVAQIHAWNPRKQQVFKPEHIRTACGQLAQQSWMCVHRS